MVHEITYFSDIILLFINYTIEMTTKEKNIMFLVKNKKQNYAYFE